MKKSFIAQIIGEDEKLVSCAPETINRITECLHLFPNYQISEISDAEYQYGDTTRRHTIICLFGGKNGSGDWMDYLEDLKNVFQELKKRFVKVWLIKLTNHCPNDVHTIFIGLN